MRSVVSEQLSFNEESFLKKKKVIQSLNKPISVVLNCSDLHHSPHVSVSVRLIVQTDRRRLILSSSPVSSWGGGGGWGGHL